MMQMMYTTSADLMRVTRHSLATLYGRSRIAELTSYACIFRLSDLYRAT